MQIEFGVVNGWLAAVEGMKRYYLATVEPCSCANSVVLSLAVCGCGDAVVRCG